MLHLSRNYGQTAALMAAIQNSGGAVIITMDGDGQNDPGDIPRLIAKLEEGFDVVSGWRMMRQDALIRRLPSTVANRISGLLHVPLHDYGCTLKATAAKSSRMCASTVRCTGSSRSTPLGRGPASPSAPLRTIPAGSGDRNMVSAGSPACCSIC